MLELVSGRALEPVLAMGSALVLDWGLEHQLGTVSVPVKGLAMVPELETVSVLVLDLALEH